MNNPFSRKRWGTFLLCGALILIASFSSVAVAPPSGGEGGGSAQQTFLGSAADTTTAIGDNQLTSGAGKAAEEAEKAFKKALDAGLASEKYAKQFEKLGKYAGVVDKVFKIIKFGDLGTHCYTALASGDRKAFATAFNNLVKEAVKTFAGMGGQAGGAALGTLAGGVAGGGLASIVTGAVGAFLGGWVGDYLASEGAGAAYDAFLSDWVKNDLSNMIFDQIGAGNKGPGGSGVTDGGGQGPLLPSRPGSGSRPKPPVTLPRFR